MSELPLPVMEHAQLYAQSRSLTISKQLGGGYDGIVFATSRATAVKALKYRRLYCQERDVYRRLQERAIRQIAGFEIPSLIDFSDDFSVIEMTIVTAPYILDFAGASLDQSRPYPEDVVREWLDEKQEQFGADWPLVRRAIHGFEALGIYLKDVHPGNAACR
jgi:hypothetical protein